MIRIPLRYARLRGRIAWNAVLRSGLPRSLAGGGALLAIASSVQFGSLLGAGLARSRAQDPARFASELSILVVMVQLVFGFVAIGSISIRLFDPRRDPTADLLVALPISRLDRFLIRLGDVSAVPAFIVAGVILPALLASGLPPAAAALAGLLSFAVCLQPVPALLALYSLALRVVPPRWLRNRWLAMAALTALFAPGVPVLASILRAWHAGRIAPDWLPGAWFAHAVGSAVEGRLAGAALPSLATVLLLVAWIAAAYVAFDPAAIERFDGALAGLDEGGRRPQRGSTRRAAAPVGSALTRIELLGLRREPALQITFAALFASGAAVLLFAERSLLLMAGGAVGFLSVYLAACLGLASFSAEGRDLPVLHPLPVTASEVLRAKFRVNAWLLAAAGAIAGGAIAVSASPATSAPWRVLPAAAAGAAAVVPLSALVTAMAAIFPRRLEAAGRREVSVPAIGFFSALAGLALLSAFVAAAGPAILGPFYLWIPALLLLAWTTVARSLVRTATRNFYRPRERRAASETAGSASGSRSNSNRSQPR